MIITAENVANLLGADALYEVRRPEYFSSVFSERAIPAPR
jgi:hypothetical protein